MGRSATMAKAPFRTACIQSATVNQVPTRDVARHMSEHIQLQDCIVSGTSSTKSCPSNSAPLSQTNKDPGVTCSEHGMTKSKMCMILCS